jgi:hypothetical protein
MHEEIRRWRDGRRALETPSAPLGRRRLSIDDREVVVVRRRSTKSAVCAAAIRER